MAAAGGPNPGVGSRRWAAKARMRPLPSSMQCSNSLCLFASLFPAACELSSISTLRASQAAGGRDDAAGFGAAGGSTRHFQDVFTAR